MKLPVGIPGVKLEEVSRNVPDGEPPPMPINEKLKVVGKSVGRLDGRLKVTGAAKYTSDINLPGMLYGKMLTATVTAGRIVSIDTSEAEKLPGVKAVHVLTAGNEGNLPPVRYAGQPIAAVAATSLHIARDAIKLIKVEYETSPWVVDLEKARQPEAPLVFSGNVEQGATAGGGGGLRGVQQRGNVRGPGRNRNAASAEQLEQAFAGSDAVVEAVFHTQVQTHSALETHGVVADWKQDGITVWASTQGTLSVRNEVAQVFGVQRGQVRVITEFMGGGFGAKFGAGAWGVLATHLSKKAGAPVKLMCDRKEEHWCTGNRPDSHQTLKVGAKKDGSLTAIHLVNYGTGGTGGGAGASGPVNNLYPCSTVLTEDFEVYTHAGPAAAFRAPGYPQGTFSFEQAIDELAEKLGIDPLVMRDKIDPSPARKAEREAGAAKFGWSKRHAPGADPGPVKRGIGVAQSYWFRPSRSSASCEVRITRDGSVEVLSAVQDIGGGIRTVMGQIAAEELGLKTSDVTVRIGDTNFPPGVDSGGSVTTNFMAPPTRNAAAQVKAKLLEQVAPALGVAVDDLGVVDGTVRSKSDPSKSLSFKAAAAKIAGEHISATAQRTPDYATGAGMGGVQFVEVAVDTDTGVVKVERVLAVHDCGRPLNPLLLASQINGGVIQGISYALYEDRILDRQTGFMVNSNLEQYKIAGSKDIPDIQVHLIEEYQGRTSVDAGGIGEPATIPTAAAIGNAVYNALGVRVRTIPMTPRIVLASIEKARGRTAKI
jgi:xanthine dehydrogenase YagR molybdenum-binding subunit